MTLPIRNSKLPLSDTLIINYSYSIFENKVIYN